MDYVAIINCGKSTFKVQFSDGVLSSTGSKPAIYRTSDYMMQHVIENSAQYKSGLIKKIHSIELNEEVHIYHNAPKPTAEETEEPSEGTQAEQTNDKSGESYNGADADAEASADAAAGAGEQLTEVEVTCLTEAQVYLKENFGIASSKARTRAAAQEYARANGIKFVGLE